MNRSSKLVSCVVMVGLLVCSIHSFAQSGGAKQEPAPAAQPAGGTGRGCPMMQGKGPMAGGMPGCCSMLQGGGNMPAACAEMMKTMGMSPGMMMGCKMRMGATVSKDDPGSILALKSELGLTEEQVKKLEALQKKTQGRAAKILNDEQKKKLAEVPDAAQMMEMCQKMMQQGAPAPAAAPAAPKAK